MISAIRPNASNAIELRGEDIARPAIERSSPLALPGKGIASLPPQASVTLAKQGLKPDSLLIDRVNMGAAQIELGGGYRVSIDDRDRTVVVDNAALGSRTTIFGDGRIETPDGKPLQFWGTTSLRFGDDVKLTLQTVADPEAQGSFRLDKLIVTNGDKAAIISGIADNKEEQLAIKTAAGYTTDERFRDGFTLEEGKGGIWRDENGRLLNQKRLDATAVGGEYGPGSQLMSLGEISLVISRFLLTSFSNAFLSQSVNRSQDWSSHQTADDRKSAERNHSDRLAAERIAIDQQSQLDQSLDRSALLNQLFQHTDS
jgi:hypothetical protein